MSVRVTSRLHAINRSLLPPTQTPLEFQPAVENANVYPSLVPLDLASLDLQPLGIMPLGAKTSLRSHVHEPIRNLISTVDPLHHMDESIDSRAMDLVDACLNHVNDFEGLDGYGQGDRGCHETSWLEGRRRVHVTNVDVGQ
ncbi:hypothetical protein B0I35DRAFT_156461 [Stachybotrys elegans]|uniref:Uncharacterized protein n=1 Tax=Stachybotrys elegans TaxID=80388 RepID=A0A8K0WK84_9HYPO|nr:hypothetical protein B0I35DRAFT_156461 [Stachybotrys elegans]